MRKLAVVVPSALVGATESTHPSYERVYLAGEVDAMTDGDLPPIQRTNANFWQAKYFEALVELRKANKGAARLRRRLDRALKRSL